MTSPPHRARRRVISSLAGVGVLALALCVLAGVATAEHLAGGTFAGEHERVGMVRRVADLAVANLNAMEPSTLEPFTLGRIISVDNAVNHAYKSLLPRGETPRTGSHTDAHSSKSSLKNLVGNPTLWERMTLVLRR